MKVLPIIVVFLVFYPILAESANEKEYTSSLQQLQQRQKQLKQELNSSSRSSSAAQIQEHLFKSIFIEIIPFWYDTPWSFNGTSTIPQHGSIACGYFVSTVLRDANFKVNRITMAQQPSEYIIQSLVNESHIKRFRNKSPGQFVQKIRMWGKGIYIVGLDFHTGFIVHDGEQVFFIHSSYLPPYKVVKELAVDSQALKDSNYKVVGKLSSDTDLMQTWVNEKPIVTKTLHK